MTDKSFDATDSFSTSYRNFENNFPLDAQKQRSRYYEIDRRHTYLLSEVKAISKKDGKLSSSDVQLMKSMLMECVDLADKKVGISENLMSLINNSMSKLDMSSKKNLDATQVCQNKQNKRNPKKFLKLAPDSEDNDSASIEVSDKTSSKEHSLQKMKIEKTNSDKISKTSESLFSNSDQDTEPKDSEPQHSKIKTLKSSSSSSTSNKDCVEPTYCICEEISYGDMVCCDNDLCPIEWFHFGCVSLKRNPKGKWYCLMCRGSSSRRMKPRKLFLKELKDYNKRREEKFK